MSIKSGVDMIVIYKIIKALATPFDETDAYRLGLIDEKGKKLKNASTREEKEAMTYFDRFVFNLKRILAKFGMTSRVSNMAAALFLLKENPESPEDQIVAKIVEYETLMNNSGKHPMKYIEEEITNSTGPAVVGTGPEGVTWVDNRKRKRIQMGEPGDRRVYGRHINAVAYIKRAARKSARDNK